MTLEEKVKQIVVDSLHAEASQVTPAASFVNDLGADSLDQAELMMNIEDAFKQYVGDNIPEEIDEEILSTVSKFFENNLNVSETSRQLYIHRNTLIYRIEKLQKATGLDVRVFDDALTLKIALMVVNYMKYIKGSE